MKSSAITLGIIWGHISLFTFTDANSQSSNKNISSMKMQCEVKGEGNPIVLVGGGLTGWASWEPFVKTFNEKHRKVIRLQLLAVQLGLENRPLPDNYSVKLESSALAATLDSLGFTQPIDFVAWSYGALTSLNFSLDHPERIRTLTLIEPPAIWTLRETGKIDDEMKKTADFFMTYKGDITEDMLADFLVHAGFVPPGKSARDLPQWSRWVNFRQSLRDNPYAVLHSDSIQRLKKFNMPTLLVKGTGSTKWLHSIIDVLAENIPHSRVVEYPGGHAPHIATTDKFLEELEKFQTNLK